MGTNEREKPHGAGRSSFGLVNPELVFNEFRLGGGITFLDLGCGRGEYAMAAAEIIGDEGLVYAVDLWEEGIASLKEQILARQIDNLKPMLADAGKMIPIEDNSVDLCFMATVFHDLVLANVADGALEEILRVIKRDGLLAILEFEKVDGPPGPPLSSRLSPEEVQEKVAPHGFEMIKVTTAGEYTYLMIFEQKKTSRDG
jgi:ubiquinone/menaquinone biosynthesis C-methylase UbiE